jgi:hypothetical protein
MCATGVPPHIQILFEIRENHRRLMEFTANVGAMCQMNNVNNTPATVGDVQRIVLEVVNQVVLPKLSTVTPPTPPADVQAVQEIQEEQVLTSNVAEKLQFSSFTWTGDSKILRPVPQGWNFPTR